MIEFQINANDHLSQDALAFYHVRYTGMGKPANPDYLNHLKNTYNSFADRKLRVAVQELTSVLQEDLPKIHARIEFTELHVCVVPRAKAEKAYHKKQQLFRSTVRSVVRRIPGLIDGTNYLRRHTNTKTTHLRQPIPNYNNDGPEPYPGILEDTCDISPEVRDNHILLIDDIYTPGVNIDEDAIGTLMRSGVSTVTFYAVGKVERGAW
ncbi:amidophosphoribosyltransferase [Nitrosococcus halophilus Nc 4]|uniref:Amidophosphoribosyltransferase n=1 Tax=Nitrosococcus halophilus (strain Nc4) TaxID=472759 RepID=D5BV39_NITHN|nr:hypothetical protein [Nitrosococcus halophilus]ADE15389.1 amidophosphoribosyltransferase [Nitrosococcus halophilus Nc 4]